MLSIVDINISSPSVRNNRWFGQWLYFQKYKQDIWYNYSVQLFNNIITIQEVLVLQVFCAGWK